MSKSANNPTEVSPRVNSARLPDYVNRTVRLIAKIVNIDEQSNTAIVQATDGGEVKVRLTPGPQKNMNTSFVEIIGTVTEPDTIKMQACFDIGDDLDVSLADFVVEKWHDPKFAGKIF